MTLKVLRQMEEHGEGASMTEYDLKSIKADGKTHT